MTGVGAARYFASAYFAPRFWVKAGKPGPGPVEGRARAGVFRSGAARASTPPAGTAQTERR